MWETEIDEIDFSPIFFWFTRCLKCIFFWIVFWIYTYYICLLHNSSQEVQENPRTPKLGNSKKKNQQRIFLLSPSHLLWKKFLSHFLCPLFPLSYGIAAVFSFMNFNKIKQMLLRPLLIIIIIMQEITYLGFLLSTISSNFLPFIIQRCQVKIKGKFQTRWAAYVLPMVIETLLVSLREGGYERLIYIYSISVHKASNWVSK